MSTETDAPPEEALDDVETTSEDGAEGTSATMAAKLGQTLEEVDSGPPIWLTAGGGALAFIALLVLLEVASSFPSLRMIITAIQIGGTLSLVSLGIGLVFKATRVLNFAQGSLGSLPAFVVMYIMLVWKGDKEVASVVERSVTGPDISAIEWWGFAIFAMVLGALMAMMINNLLVRRLANASPVTSLVATAAVALLVIGIQVAIFGVQVKSFPRPIDGNAFTVSGVAVPWHTIVVLVILVGVSVALAAFFRTPAGVALLGTAQEPFAAELYGVSVKTMSNLAWAAAGALGGLAGMLAGGFFDQILPAYMTRDWVIPAFTAAVLGGVTSMPGVVLGAMILGLISAGANELNLFLDLGLPSPPQLATLVVLILILIVRPRGLLGKDA